MQSDGIPIITEVDNIYGQYIQPAFNQSKTWHPPTRIERTNLSNIFNSFYNKDTKTMAEYADKLNLSIYRCIKQYPNKTDSYLILFTKKGINNYSGPFIMLRETTDTNKPSKVIMIIPHNGSDGTNQDSVLGFQNSNALACISNGCKHGLTHQSDFVDHTNTLGSISLRILNQLYPNSVFFHVHGSRSDKICLYRCRNPAMSKSFEKAIKDFTKINTFKPFNAGYSIDNICKSNYYLKTEIPAKIHMNNDMILANIIKTFESNNWAWQV